jgi:hypothetical protein
MDTQEILSKIAKLKKAVASESDADVKASYNKKIATLEAQVAEAEAKVEKKEDKSAAEEKKTLTEAEEKIKKLEKAIASESDADVKARYQKKLNELKGTLKDVKEEIKEEKKEIAEQKKEIKQAVKEVKSVQSEVRKTAIKKVATKIVERKKVEVKKTKRGEKLQSVLSDLDAMIEKNKKLKSKYGSGYTGTGKPIDLERDAKRGAKPFGYRFVGKHDYRVPTEMQIKRGLKRGTIDYEARPNRSDVYPERKIKLADGGMMADGGKVDARTYLHINKKNDNDVFPLIDDGYYVKLSKHKQVNLGGQIIESGMTKTEAINFAKDLMSRLNIPNENLIIDEKYRVDQFADGGMMEDGGMMKKGGKVKVGKSKEDRARFAKPAGWRWKEEALTKRIIERKQLSMSPSKKMRDKYPDFVYYEDRLNKADVKPTRTSADSI